MTECLGVLRLTFWIVNCCVRIVCNYFQLLFGEDQVTLKFEYSLN